jgi:hypothetical protein
LRGVSRKLHIDEPHDFVPHTKRYLGDQTEDKMDSACGKYGTEKMPTGYW